MNDGDDFVVCRDKNGVLVLLTSREFDLYCLKLASIRTECSIETCRLIVDIWYYIKKANVNANNFKLGIYKRCR